MSMRERMSDAEFKRLMSVVAQDASPEEWIDVLLEARRARESEAALLRVARAALGTHGDPCPEPGRSTCRFLTEARAAIAKAAGGEPASEERLRRLFDSSEAFTREAAAIGRSVATGERAAIPDPERCPDCHMTNGPVRGHHRKCPRATGGRS